jgi:hypothetical protein
MTLGSSKETDVAFGFNGATKLFTLGDKLVLRDVYDPTSILLTFSTLDLTKFCTLAHSFKNWLFATLGDLLSPLDDGF